MSWGFGGGAVGRVDGGSDVRERLDELLDPEMGAKADGRSAFAALFVQRARPHGHGGLDDGVDPWRGDGARELLDGAVDGGLLVRSRGARVGARDLGGAAAPMGGARGEDGGVVRKAELGGGDPVGKGGSEVEPKGGQGLEGFGLARL